MGMFSVVVDNREFRYFDNGGAVMVDGEIIGQIDEQKLDIYRTDSDEERRRSEEILSGSIRAMARRFLDDLNPTSDL